MDPHHFNFHLNHTQTLAANQAPPTSASPPQSVPGRRTPLGAVGIGGFYAQPHASTSSHSDENKPSALLIGPESSGLAPPGNSNPGKQKARQGKSVRLNINARERRRMHDLNDALDGNKFFFQLSIFNLNFPVYSFTRENLNRHIF